jgi:hypothetical protein
MKLKNNFNFRDAAYLNKISAGFSRHGQSPLSGCVSALDGIAIKIQKPCRGSVANTSTYCSSPDDGRAHWSECLRKSNGDKGFETVYGGTPKGGIDVGRGQSDPRGSCFAH